MARAGSYDGEIGRGRLRKGDDSSSSRESSPARPRPKRSYSPTSDDGDTVQPVVEDDTTPPPAERPLLRKAVGFGSQQPSQATISTYEANVEPTPKTTHFLPGQAVPLAAKPKAPRKSKTGVKRPRRPDAYPGQTSRFRLETYDPTPSSEPPIAHGNGPYSSLYRGVVPAQDDPRQESPADASTTATDSPSGAAESVHTGNASTLQGSATSNESVSSRSQPPQPPSINKQHTSMNVRQSAEHRSSPLYNSQTHSQPSSSKTPQLSPHPHSHSQSLPSSPPLQSGPSRFVTDTSLTIREKSSPGAHYRHNYEEKEWSPPSEPRRRSSTANTGAKSTSSADSPTQKRSKAPPRLITLLIDDIRSGTSDLQLAEMNVPLRKSEDPAQPGFWADAKDVAEQLQSGPSRIDGPARAFTLRGKYRQFILRVSADNVDEFVSTNVAIQPDKTMELVIETLQPPGSAPRPPQIPREMYGPTYDEYDRRSDERMDVEPLRPLQDSRKRAKSPFDDYEGYSTRSSHVGSSKVARHDRPWERSPRHDPPPYAGSHRSINSTLEHDPWRRSHSNNYYQSYGGAYHRGTPPLPSPPRRPRPLPTSVPVSSPEPVYPRRSVAATEGEEDDDMAPPDEPFIRAVDRLLREDHDAWSGYFRASANSRACDLVKQYRIIMDMFMMWVGKRPPGFIQVIEESHIVRAMEIEDGDTFIRKCKETLHLLNLYGKKGRISEVEEVMEIIDDKRIPAPGNDPGRKLIRLLRALDDARINDARGPTLDGINPPERDKYSTPTPPPQNRPPSAIQPSDHHTEAPSSQATPQRQHSKSHSHSSPLPRPPAESNGHGDRHGSKGKAMFVQ